MLLITQQPFNVLHNTENQEKFYNFSHMHTHLPAPQWWTSKDQNMFNQ